MPKQKKTTAEAADGVGITPQALGKWASRPGAPVETAKNGERVYLWPDFPRWREQELVRQAKAEVVGESTANANRYEAARAERIEMEVRQLKGELVSVEESVQVYEKRCGALRSKLMTFPHAWAPNLMGLKSIPEAEMQLEKGISEALTVLSGAPKG